MIKPL